MFFSTGCRSIGFDQKYSQGGDCKIYGPRFWYGEDGVKKQEEEKNILLQAAPDAIDNTYNVKEDPDGDYAPSLFRSQIKGVLGRDDLSFAMSIAYLLPSIEQSFIFRYISKKCMEHDAIEEAIGAICRVPSTTQRAFAYRDFILYLLHKKDVQKAIELLEKISLRCVRELVEEEVSCHLKACVDYLMIQENFFQALEVACGIPSLMRKNEILPIVLQPITAHFLDLIKGRGLEEALYFAFRIPFEDERQKVIRSTFQCVDPNSTEFIEWVHKISLGGYKATGLKEMCAALIEELQFESAILVAYLIPQDREKYFAFEDIARALMKSDHVDRALLFISQILSEEKRISILHALFKGFLKVYSFPGPLRVCLIDKVCSIASKMPTEIDRGHIFLYLSRYVMNKKFLKEAVIIACGISIDSIKLMAIQYIFLALGGDNNKRARREEILTITHQMESEIEKSLFLLGIVGLLLEKDKCIEAYERALEIPLEKEKSKAIRQVCEYGVAKELLTFSIKIVEEIPDPEEKIMSLIDISRALIMKNRINTAIATIQKIPDEVKRSAILAGNSYSLIEESRVRAAKKMAENIPIESEKAIVMQRIEEMFRRKRKRSRSV